MADGVIVTGSATGDPADPSELRGMAFKLENSCIGFSIFLYF